MNQNTPFKGIFIKHRKKYTSKILKKTRKTSKNCENIVYLRKRAIKRPKGATKGVKPRQKMESALQIWKENRILYTPKGIYMRKEKNEAEKIQEAKECCENFKKNPAGPLILSIIYIVAIAIFIRPVLNHVYIDFRLMKTAEAGFSSIIVISAMYLLFKQCSNFFKGTEGKHDKQHLRATGVTLVCAGIIAAIISGYTTDKYGWIEDEALADLNVNELKQAPIKCTGVDINRHNGNAYYGIAKLSDGTTKPTVVYYLRGKYRRYSVEYKIAAKFM